jgi:ATP-dependent RNA helicase RhlE
MELVNALLRDPVKVAVDPVSLPVEVIRQSLYFVDNGQQDQAALPSGCGSWGVKNALVFTRTKHGANKVASDLVKSGITAAAIHGNKSQTARQQALTDFKAGKVQCLVATDIAARGIDIEELSHVFNYNLPEVPETYVHHRPHRPGGPRRHGHLLLRLCRAGVSERHREADWQKAAGGGGAPLAHGGL